MSTVAGGSNPAAKTSFKKKTIESSKTQGDASKTKSWRFIPPKDGEPTEKFVDNKATGKKENKRM
jgi:hypothetical protein